MSHFRHSSSDSSDPHGRTQIHTAGPPPQTADATLILLHGRGATAQSIPALYAELALPNLAALAPQAAGNVWYPQSFLAPLEENQPYLDSALRRIESIVTELLGDGIPSARIAILGFSQGACLTSEFAARHPRRYGAVIALTGGLIGPPGTPRNYPGSLQQTPVLLASSDPDPHVPFARVRETESILAGMGAVVDLRRYPGLPHTICEDEIIASRDLLNRVVSGQEK
jgi:predicted esterase